MNELDYIKYKIKECYSTKENNNKLISKLENRIINIKTANKCIEIELKKLINNIK